MQNRLLQDVLAFPPTSTANANKLSDDELLNKMERTDSVSSLGICTSDKNVVNFSDRRTRLTDCPRNIRGVTFKTGKEQI